METLLKKQSKTQKIIDELQIKIDECDNATKKALASIKINQEEVTLTESKWSYFNSGKRKRLADEIRATEKNKNDLIKEIKERRLLSGSDIPFSNKNIVQLSAKIKDGLDTIALSVEANNRIEECESNITQYKKNLKGYNRDILKIKQDNNKCKNIMNTIKKMLKEEELRPKYVEYAKKYNIEYDEDNPINIFKIGRASCRERV